MSVCVIRSILSIMPAPHAGFGHTACAGVGSFNRVGCGIVFDIYPVDAEKRDRGDQGVDWWLEQLVKTYYNQ